MRKVADAVSALRGWPQVVVATAAGAASAMAMAPWFAFPILWFSLPVLVWLIDGAEAQAKLRHRLARAAVVGWSFGFGYFLAGLWWIGAAFFVDADKFVWLMPLAVVGLPAFLALFWALGAVLARLVWLQGWARILVFAAAFSVVEWLRGHVLSGFPWNAFGYALSPTPAMMQSAALVGLWGLTLGAFVIFAAPALLVPVGGKWRREDCIFVVCTAAILMAHVAFGVVRLAGAEDRDAASAVRLRIVQPAIPQNEKWLEENADAIFELQLELSAIGSDQSDDPIDGFDMVVWPESAFPFYLEERPDALTMVAELLPAGTVLIAGAARLGSPLPGEPTPVFNSILVINAGGEISGVYDKAHLVPFGEFLPFQSALESLGLSQLTEMPGGFAAGPGRRTIAQANLPAFGPLICYEVIFPGAVTARGRRPGWLLNVTNDAWYGDTPGPRQHFHQARLRAVEEGLPLVRAANTGISAIVDAYGNVIASLGIDEMGVVDGLLPQAGAPTLYGRYGDLVFWAVLVGVGCAATFKQSNKVAYANRQK